MSTIMDSGVSVQTARLEVPLGFATVYRQIGDQHIGVWLTSVMELQGATHTNAVVTSREDMQKVETMAYRRIVVVVGSDPVQVPRAITVDQLHDLFEDACTARQAEIDSAIDTHVRMTRNRNLTRPEWRPAPTLAVAASDDAPHHTLATANYVAALWNRWLFIDTERRKRIAFPAMADAGLVDPRPEVLPAVIASWGL